MENERDMVSALIKVSVSVGERALHKHQHKHTGLHTVIIYGGKERIPLRENIIRDCCVWVWGGRGEEHNL